MAAKVHRWQSVLVLLLAFLVPSPAIAGPFFGEWSWCWRPAPDCPRGVYSPCHYWCPEIYYIRACVCPSNLDQYPPGPFPPVAPVYQFNCSPCQSAPAMPSSPYANPEAYYGRAIAPK